MAPGIRSASSSPWVASSVAGRCIKRANASRCERSTLAAALQQRRLAAFQMYDESITGAGVAGKVDFQKSLIGA